MAAHAIERPSGETGGSRANPAREADQQLDARWKPVLSLRCDLTVDLPIPKFQIGDLLKLRQGSVINAHWRVGQDVPLCLNATRIGWIEFEIVSGHLAARLTELA